MSSAKLPPPKECANCGAAIPRHARSCPECGADEATGWRENDATRYDGIDLPESVFEDESTAKSRSSPDSRKVNGMPWYWWCVGVALLILVLASFLR